MHSSVLLRYFLWSFTALYFSLPGAEAAGLCADSFVPPRPNYQSTHKHRVSDGMSPLLDELAFSPAAPNKWIAWLNQPRKRPDLSALPRINSHTNLLSNLAKLQLADIIGKPGHMIVRNPEKIIWFAEHDADLAIPRIKRGNPDPAVLNVITDQHGQVLFVDAWDGHHRLLGALHAGKKTLAEVSASGLRILLNGVDSQGVLQKTTPPSAGVDFRNAQHWKGFIEPTREQSRFADVWVNGANSNWELGSVFTLKDLLESNFSSPYHNVGVLRTSSLERLNRESPERLSKLGIHEVLVVPEMATNLSALAMEIRKLNNDLASENRNIRFNLYVGNGEGFIAHFGADSFLRRIQETYITRSLPRFLDPTSLKELAIKPLGYEAPISQIRPLSKD